MQSHIEPDRTVECSVLVDANVSQLAVKIFRVIGGCKITVLQSPVGDGAGDAVNQLADRFLMDLRSFGAVKIF